MEHTPKEWIRRDCGHPELIEKLAAEQNVPIAIASLMVNRGLTDADSADAFFRPRVDDLHNPSLMADMDKACARLCHAIQNGEPILVYGDYDVDGTTAVAMMYMFLANQTDHLGFYIPDRYTEGYGVSRKGIEYAHSNDYKLIITLDCGIRANAMVDLASDYRIDVIVCDHHNPGEHLPDAFAVLDPKRDDCLYPFKELSGCGVGFKLIHAVCLSLGLSLKENLFCFLDLVAVSIASDIVPIVGENRILTYFGLKKLSLSPKPGLHALMKVAGLADYVAKQPFDNDAHQQLTVTDLVFKLGPRINAAGRIESGRRAVELLVSDSVDFALSIASEINGFNEDRKDLDRQITEEALKLISADSTFPLRKTTVVYDECWHKGVVGIVASRLIEHHYRPTIVLTFSEGKVTGSARSVDGFDLYSAIEKCEHLLTNWGGHKYAAGLSMKPENLLLFCDAFEQSVSESITPDQLVPKVYIDAVLALSDISSDFYRLIQRFEPFGPGNMSPVFASHSVSDAGASRSVGADNSHLKVSIIDVSISSPIDGIGFGLGRHISEVKNSPFSLCYNLSENIFRDKVSIQLMIKDLKFV